MHGGNDLAVDGLGLQILILPDLLTLGVGPGEQTGGAGQLAVLVQTHGSDLAAHLVDVLALGLNAPLLGDPQELGGVGDVEIAVGSGVIELPQTFAAMVGVSGGAGGGHPQVVPAGNGIRGGAADALGGLGGDPAGTHGADPAADALLTEAAVRGLILDAVLPYVDTDLLRCFVQTGCVSLHLFNSGHLKFQAHKFMSSFRCNSLISPDAAHGCARGVPGISARRTYRSR